MLMNRKVQQKNLRRTKVERNRTGKLLVEVFSSSFIFVFFSSPNPLIGDRTSANASPTKLAVGVTHSKVPSNIISPVSNILSSNGGNRQGDLKKRRSVSAATASATTFLSLTGKNSRSTRTNSSSAIHGRSKSSTHSSNSKRSHSPPALSFAAATTTTTKNNHQRKKQKFSHCWALFGKSEHKLVSIDVS